MKSRRIVMQRQESTPNEKNSCEENRHIVYLDETWFDTHDVSYDWVDNSEHCCLGEASCKGKCVIILHAGSVYGFVPDALLLSAKNINEPYVDYHKDRTAELFEKWFHEQLLLSRNTRLL